MMADQESVDDRADVAARVVNEHLIGLRPIVALGILAGAAGTVIAHEHRDNRNTLITTFAAMMRLSVWSIDPSVKPPSLLKRFMTWVRHR